MRLVAAVIVLLAARAAQADPSVEVTAGAARWPGLEQGHSYGPEVTISGGTRINSRVVLGVRIAGYYLHEPTITHGDTGSVGYTTFAVRLGPSIKADVEGPVWVGGSLGFAIARQRNDEQFDPQAAPTIDYAFGLELRAGVTLYRSGFESIALSIAATTYLADGGLGVIPSAALGYQFN